MLTTEIILFLFVQFIVLHYSYILNNKLIQKKFSKLGYLQKVTLTFSSKNNDFFDDLYDSKQSRKKTKIDYDLEYDDKLKELLDIIQNKSKIDNYLSSKLHMDIIHRLIRSDMINHINIDSDNHQPRVYIPNTYTKTIVAIKKITEIIPNHHPCYILIKLILKKESLQQTITSDVSILSSLYLSIRDLIELERKIERSLSLIILILFTYNENNKLVNHNEINESFLYFSKILLERIPIHERHITMLILCRGIISYGYNCNPNKHKLDVQGLFHYNTKSLKDNFICGMKAHGITNPKSTYRMLYPFAASVLRSFTNSNIYPMNQNLNNNIENEMKQYLFDGSIEEWKLCKFLSKCYLYEQQTNHDKVDGNNNDEERLGIHQVVDDVIHSIRRWIIELLGYHFINEDIRLHGALDTRIDIPDIIRSNTVAMELLCTDNAFVEGIKKDRLRYAHTSIELGRYLNIICSSTTSSATTIVHNDDEDDGDTIPLLATTSPDEISVIGNIKKLMTIISIIKWLPISNNIRKQIELRFQLRKEINQEYVIIPQIPINKLIDEDLFWDVDTKRKVDLIDSSYMPIDRDLLDHQNQDLKKNIHMLLLYALNELLQVKNIDVFTQEKISEEIHIIFNTWRRPHILLDYFKMHYSNKSIRLLYLRFLKALFGISKESFDDIRYLDPRNKYHLDLFDPELIETWIYGKTKSGDWLPGFNDPETILMIGEDTHTCMTIRPRQKGTNRGLLSILLHGSCRILGIKDHSGKLTSRAIVRLLFDEKTSRPMLYVDTPYGLSDNTNHIDIYDQAGELGRLLQLPVIYSKPPPIDEYALNEYEACAIQYTDTDITTDTITTISDNNHAKKIVAFAHLLDYSKLSPYIWVNGVYDYQQDTYLYPYTPKLIPIEQASIQSTINNQMNMNDNINTNINNTSINIDITVNTAIVSNPGIVMGVRPIDFFVNNPLSHMKCIYQPSSDLSSTSSSTSRRSSSSDVIDQFEKLTNNNNDMIKKDQEYFNNIQSTSANTIRNKNRKILKPLINLNKENPILSQLLNDNNNNKIDDNIDELNISSKKRHAKSIQYLQYERKKILEQENQLKYNQRFNIKNTTTSTTNSNNINNKNDDKRVNKNKEPKNIKDNRDMNDEDEFFYPIFD